MVYRKRRRSTKKRPYTRKKRNGTRKRRSNGMKGTSAAMPLGKTFKFKTRYVQLGNILDPSGPGAFPVTHVWSLNGLFDPNVTGAGHQVIGFDQLMPNFDHYCVIGARVRCTFTNKDFANSSICALQIKDTQATSPLLTESIENGLVTYKVLSTAGAGGATKTLTTQVSMNKFFGRKVMQGTKYAGTSTSNPLDGCFLHVTVGPTDVITDIAATLYSIEIEYIAILTEPRQLTQS